MSLYTIEENLLRIFADIEANEGEITDELFAELNLTKENLNAKLENYVKAIRSWEAEAESAKVEANKLVANAEVKTNRVKRLKLAMLSAVQVFGMNGKSGNKVIDLPNYKLFTKGSQSTEVDNKRISKLIEEFERFVRELVENDVLYTGSDVELQGILDVINTNCKAEYDNESITDLEFDLEGLLNKVEFIPYTLADLITIKIKISTTRSIYDLFRNGKDILVMYSNNPTISTIQDTTPKDDWKTAIGIADSMNVNLKESDIKYTSPTVAKIVKNTSIQIK